ncbi:MAG: hypothetical protein NTX15_05390 [Candidatus Kapabacteria bacterium]|nr:hypothetical protein [Candidatus Kapabacteria bacterium]
MASNQYALILGASSGFGRAAALALAADGFNIIGVHLDRAGGLLQVEELKAELIALGVRVTLPSFVVAFVGFWNAQAVHHGCSSGCDQ